MRISDWSSDVCSSDLTYVAEHEDSRQAAIAEHNEKATHHLTKWHEAEFTVGKRKASAHWHAYQAHAQAQNAHNLGYANAAELSEKAHAASEKANKAASAAGKKSDAGGAAKPAAKPAADRKRTRLNSSH